MEKQLKALVGLILVFGEWGGQVQAAPLLIDDFTMTQIVNDYGGDALAISTLANPLTGTDLINASRNVSASATGDAFESESVLIGGSYLRINNTIGSNGTAFIDYNFDTADFTANGTAILLKVLAIDLGVQVNMSINGGAASSGYQAFTGIGNFYKLYTAFAGDASQFTHVNNLRLDFKGITAWDGKFQLLTSDTPPNNVPEPVALALLGIGLAAFGVGKKKHG